ncbi:MAG: FAD:protein FMN transferase [Myxococcales bacterium]|nr:FAD:protein FMN transferase [Myxococcales bacterium]
MSPPPAAGEGPGAFRRFVLPALFVVGLFFALYLRRPDNEPPAARTVTAFRGATMGTTYTVKIAGPALSPADENALGAAIDAELEAVNDQMSTWRKTSELSRLNQSESTDPQPASEALRLVIAEALRINKLSGGAFDITVGPLVNAWGFGPGGEHTPPDEATLSGLRARVGPDKLSFDDATGTVRKARADVYVDLSAIAKGHGVDRVAAVLEHRGHGDFLVEIGGEVRVAGKNGDGQTWRVGIEKPDENARDIQEIIALDGGALATSGDYRNFYEKDGVRLSHTIDPRTGRPIAHRLASVSVIAPTCMTADGLATALNVLGPDEGLALAEQQGLAALFIVRETDGRFTERATAPFAALRAAAASN